MVKRDFVIEDWNGGAVHWLESYDRDSTRWTPHIHEAALLTEAEARMLLRTHCSGMAGACMCKLSEVRIFGSRS